MWRGRESEGSMWKSESSWLGITANANAYLNWKYCESIPWKVTISSRIKRGSAICRSDKLTIAYGEEERAWGPWRSGLGRGGFFDGSLHRM